jgi:hypothetical protein
MIDEKRRQEAKKSLVALRQRGEDIQYDRIEGRASAFSALT